MNGLTDRNGRTLVDGTRVLVDDGHATGQPTRKNILRALSWLVKGAEAGDSLLFHFSGRAEVPAHALGARGRGAVSLIHPRLSP